MSLPALLPDSEEQAKQKVLSAEGEVAALMRAMDWSQTGLGPVQSWPQSLRTAVSIILHSRFELFLWWGPELYMLYNDAYRQTLQAKHPQALGKPGIAVWPEIWPIIGPMLRRVMDTGKATLSHDLVLFLERHGYPEETYHTFSYSPIINESGGVGGVFTAVTETTEQVIGQRRLRTLRDLAARSADAKTEAEAWQTIAAVLAENPYDVQFAVLYALDDACDRVHAVAHANIDVAHQYCPHIADLQDSGECASCIRWITQAIRSWKPVEVQGVHTLGVNLPGGRWGEEPQELIIMPVLQTGQARPLGAVVAGVSRRKLLDENYRSFFDILAGQIAKSISDAQAFEKERKRAEALAELDSAKTAFFSNVSHEFRTPLTLMLGPLEDAIGAGSAIPDAARNGLQTVHRNGLRLLKLVNALLDFSRMESGRAQAVFEPVDLPAFTAQLASVFRSAVEKAGLYLRVETPHLAEPVYVDREMWEKIVLNLLSNAFKFTFSGGITVSTRATDSHVLLGIADTGTGIPKNELARLFERFHRIEGARGRSFEGSGIGLALVQELVKMHGGEVTVDSALERGTTFTVSVPKGKAHLPPDRIGKRTNDALTAFRSETYVEESLSWLPPESAELLLAADSGTVAERDALKRSRGTVLLADDNADMRNYVRRLVEKQHRVVTAQNGEEALQLARKHHPDLVLTDVMMPVVDGFGLMHKLRADPETAGIPVVMLSARAGEESRVEGLDAGADDYLVKPFTARELLARVNAHILMARTRREASEKERQLRAQAEMERRRLQELFTQAPACLGVTRGPDHRWEYLNPYYVRVLGRRDASEFVGKAIRETLPEVEGQGFFELLDNVYSSGTPHVGRNAVVSLPRGDAGVLSEVFFDFMYQPICDATGKVDGVLIHAVDVTDKVVALREVERKQESLEAALAASGTGTFRWSPESGEFLDFGPNLKRLFGIPDSEYVRTLDQVLGRIHPEDRPDVLATLERTREGEDFAMEYRVVLPGGDIRWLYDRGKLRSDKGKGAYLVGACTDISARKLSQQALIQSEKLASVGRLAATIAHEINNPLESATNLVYLAVHQEDLPSAVKTFLYMAEEELARVAQLTRQTLGFYREQTKAMQTRVGPLLQQLVSVLGPKTKNKQLDVRLDINSDPEVLAVPSELRQLFANLLSNSIDAVPRKAKIWIRVSSHNLDRPATLRISVADSGPGIPADVRSRIFEPFFTTKKDFGTGLGMWVCKNIVDKHGGRIQIHSSTKPQRSWTVVSVVLPIRTQHHVG